MTGREDIKHPRPHSSAHLTSALESRPTPRINKSRSFPRRLSNRQDAASFFSSPQGLREKKANEVMSCPQSRSMPGSLVFQVDLAQRSSAVSVKALICRINERCTQKGQQQTSADDTILAPKDECDTLIRWATDVYYQVVVSKNDGIETIIRSMQVFADDGDYQALCCRMLATMSEASDALKQKVEDAGGFKAIESAVNRHPSSQLLQSSSYVALEQLRKMHPPTPLKPTQISLNRAA